jgi:hypothetical protein
MAESLTVTERRVLHTHERTGATTSLLTIRREDKNEPLGLEDALALAKSSASPFLVNTSSNRAALGAPASSLTLDDGTIEERIRLIRPLSRDAVPKARIAGSHWQTATEEEFRYLWLKELQDIPPTRSSELYLVSGLLLPVWKHLPRAASKVYRLQTDDGERIVGRLINATDVPNLRAAFTLDGGPALSAEDAHRLLLSGSPPIALRGGISLRVSTVMGGRRIELTGFRDTEVEQLKSLGLFSEIIAWRLRLFLPVESRTGIDALSRLFLLAPPLAADAGAVLHDTPQGA